MKYSLKLEVDYNKEIENLFKDFQESTDRLNISILKNKNKFVFDIKANDSVALRSVLNSITKLFTVYEKMDLIYQKSLGN
jgi:tRNA threonylcarbamoyladenosine modification (KEOPS) complex  Pcc1 subunit